MTHQYLFYYGVHQDLSLAELNSVLPDVTISPLAQHVLHLTSKKPLNLNNLSCRLGSVVKIAQKVTTAKDLVTDISEIIKDQKIDTFSVNYATGHNSTDLNQQVKSLLKSQSYSTRFVLNKKDFLSPLIIDSQKITEFIVDQSTNDIYQVKACHPYHHWIARDRQKPYLTPHSGMLPPKLARILINLAVGNDELVGKTLLDPFCGTGTILMEASLLGLNNIGSDISTKHLDGAKKNLAWLPQDHACADSLGSYQLIQADATHISKKLSVPVDYIVTEPFLGSPNPKAEKIKDMSKGLSKLYLGAVKDWLKILKPGGKVVITLPIFNLRGKQILTSSLIDSRENLGYNLHHHRLVFTRPGATITRQIIILEKN